MGITHLLPFLERSTRVCHVSEFRGQSVAVDSYCWLHKGVICCAEQLVRGDNTDMYVTYCIKYIKMLQLYDIKPVMVFDGRHLPAKLKTEEKRRGIRRNAKQQGIELLRLGKKDEARKFFSQCIDVTNEMAHNLIVACRGLDIDCIVAPYESDAQLAFFSLRGIADCIISEDSDLVLFGCKKVLYKMNSSGSGRLVEADKLYLSMDVKAENFSFEKFRYMCILSGCDYVDSLPGIGLKKAQKFINMTAETNPEIFLKKLPSYLNMRHLVIDDDYKDQFFHADATFLHQIVFDPFEKKLIPLTKQNFYSDKLHYCQNAGELFDDKLAFQLALGNIDPMTMKQIDNWCPIPKNNYSIWSKNYEKQLRTPKRIQLGETRTLLKTQSLSATELEKMQLQHDLETEKELEVYKERVVSIENNKLQSNETVEEEPQTSPTIGAIHNPFSIKKRISKFTVTTTNNNRTVKSRFFKSNSDGSALISVKDNLNEREYLEKNLIETEAIENDKSEIDLLNKTNKTEVLNNIIDNCIEMDKTDCDKLVIVDNKKQETFTNETKIKVNTNKRKSDREMIGKLKKKKQTTISAMFKKLTTL